MDKKDQKNVKCHGKCQFWMNMVYFPRLKIQDIFNSYLYEYISFNFGLETELDMYSSMTKN